MTDETVLDTEILEGQPDEVEDGQPVPSTGQETKPDQKTDSVQKRINAITAKRYEEQRRADELEAKVRELEAKQSSPAPQATSAPTLPEDLYDHEAMEAYQKSLIAYQTRIAQETAQKALNESKQAGVQAKQQEEMQRVISTYASNAIRDGVEIDKLRAAEVVLGQEGISPQLGQYIMSDPNGGKIAEYLHDNPVLRHELLSMDPVSAGIKIANEVKPQVLSSTPKVTNAPDPIEDINGGGVDVKEDFERKYPGTVFI